MTIDQAMRATSVEYDADVARARSSAAFFKAMGRAVDQEYEEIDQELPKYVAEIAKGMGVKDGTILPEYVYVACRMAFRMGMRVQRKLDRPHEVTTVLWRK